jgi:hypothetical protein
VSAADLCARAGISASQLLELESFGLVTKRGVGAAAGFDARDVAIASAAKVFLDHGIEGRHLRGWKQGVDREVSLFEQLALPLARQRNPEARQQMRDLVAELSAAGGQLRAALLADAVADVLGS